MKSKKKYAEILIDIPRKEFDSPFHYSIPSELESDLSFSSWVRVPFGRRKIGGYVVGFTDHPGVEKTKNISEILNPGPLFTRKLLELAYWMSEHYVCAVSQVLKKIIPTGIKKQPVKMISLQKGNQNNALSILKNAPRQKELYKNIINLLKEKDTDAIKWDEAAALSNASSPEQVMRALVKKDIITVNHSIQKPRIKKKKKRIVKLKYNREKTKKIIKGIKKQAPSQARLLSYLIDSDRDFSSTELAEACETTAGTVRRLYKKGFIDYEYIEMKRSPYDPEDDYSNREENFKLTAEQKNAVEACVNSLKRDEKETYMLHGVTGSGKTEVYLRVIADNLERGYQSLVLVPEISLTPQMMRIFKRRFKEQVAILHSGLSLGERYDEWRRVYSGSANIVVGTRSAVFAPFNRLKLIVVDEEHENTYKEENPPTYNVIQIVQKRADLNDAVVVLGSATPSLEAYYRANNGEYKLLKLNKRIGSFHMPNVEIVDMRRELKEGNKSIFSRSLHDAVKENLKKKQKVILFLNRRGFSTFVLCRDCGQAVKCSHCDVSLTFHSNDDTLKCHYCGYTEKVPQICPECRSRRIRYFGAGTEKIENAVRDTFPEAEIARMDADTTTRKGSHRRILKRFSSGLTDILIGTQMITKGLDIKAVNLVGVITADTALNFPDFRAAERTFQLLTQVAGRTGRGKKTGEVIIQSYTPEHYSIQTAKSHDYNSFYEIEIKDRAQCQYPPFTSLIIVLLKHKNKSKAVKAAGSFKSLLKVKLRENTLDDEIEILGPVSAPLEKIRGVYRWQILLRGNFSSSIKNIINKTRYRIYDDPSISGLNIIIDVDPRSML